jgi:hypothetical protein
MTEFRKTFRKCFDSAARVWWKSFESVGHSEDSTDESTEAQRRGGRHRRRKRRHPEGPDSRGSSETGTDELGSKSLEDGYDALAEMTTKSHPLGHRPMGEDVSSSA